MEDKYKAFTETSYSGRELLKKHSLSEYGIWRVYGEDPNCDMGGPHHQPDLGLYQGTLEDVIRLAVELPRFWNWGGGGDIKLPEIISAIKVNAERPPVVAAPSPRPKSEKNLKLGRRYSSVEAMMIGEKIPKHIQDRVRELLARDTRMRRDVATHLRSLSEEVASGALDVGLLKDRVRIIVDAWAEVD